MDAIKFSIINGITQWLAIGPEGMLILQSRPFYFDTLLVSIIKEEIKEFALDKKAFISVHPKIFS